MLAFDRYEACLAPRQLKTFVFPEEIDFILKPSIYKTVKKKKHAVPSIYQKIIKHEKKFNKSILQQKSDLVYLTDLALAIKEIKSDNKKQIKSNRKKEKKSESLSLHLVGLPSNKVMYKSRKTTLQLDEIETDTHIKVKYPLKASDTIHKLKECIRKTFGIPSYYDLLILYSHIVISSNNQATLNEYGITNKSVLLLAICPQMMIISPQNRNKYSFDEEKAQRASIERLDTTSIKGFDVITQESDVDVYRMPICGHVMSKESLFHYALTHFENKNNLHLTCPHTVENKEEEKYHGLWSCSHCTYMNQSNDNACRMCEYPKPWSCTRCTFINQSNANECDMCQYNKADAPSSVETQKLCREIWDYSLLKRIFMNKIPPKVIQNEERQKWMDKYYIVRHKYSKLKQENQDISIEFQKEIRGIQKRLIYEFNMNDKTDLNGIRKKAKKDIVSGRFCFPAVKMKKNKRENVLQTARLELLSARNNIQSKYKLQKCPTCCSLYYKDKKAEPQLKSIHDMAKYETKCVLCHDVSFCFCCGKEWKNGHLCDSQFRLQLIEILKNAKTKKIGDVTNVPSIRCCPKCCQLITHTEACKHMKCGSCKTKFCFVCMKLYKNDSWQCGGSSDVCPIAQRQNIKTLPNVIAINEETFQLF